MAGTVSGSSKNVLSADAAYKTTTVRVTVCDVYKGGILPGDSLSVEMNTSLGGNGATAEQEPSPPAFSPDDSVLLFLVANDHGTYYIAGVNQGAYFRRAANSGDAVQYVRQNRLGLGPETIVLADLLAYLDHPDASGATAGQQ